MEFVLLVSYDLLKNKTDQWCSGEMILEAVLLLYLLKNFYQWSTAWTGLNNLLLDMSYVDSLCETLDTGTSFYFSVNFDIITVTPVSPLFNAVGTNFT